MHENLYNAAAGRQQRVLIVGPGTKTSKGGIAAVTKTLLKKPPELSDFQISEYPSYKEGGRVKRLLYGISKIFEFPFAARNCDIIHIQMTAKGSAIRKAIYAKIAKKMHKKIIIQIHSTDYFLDTMPKCVKRKVRNALKDADAVLVLSEKFEKRLRKEFKLKNVKVLPNGIEPGKFKDIPLNICERKGILYLGKLSYQKGCFDILNALKILKDRYGLQPNCVFAGKGPYEEQLKGFAKAYGLENVSFAGWVNGKDKKELLKKSGIMLLPSYHEGFPVSILEGMAAGCYIIASDVGACSEMAEGGFIKPKDAETMAEMIRIVMEVKESPDSINHILLKRILNRNREKVNSEYNIHTIFSKLAEIYRRG